MVEFGQDKPQTKAQGAPADSEAAAWNAALNRNPQKTPAALINEVFALRASDPLQETLTAWRLDYGGADRLLSPEEVANRVKHLRISLGMNPKTLAEAGGPKPEVAAKPQSTPKGDLAKPEEKKTEGEKPESRTGSMNVAKGNLIGELIKEQLAKGAFGGPTMLESLRRGDDFLDDVRINLRRELWLAQELNESPDLQAQIRKLHNDGPDDAKGMSDTDIAIAAKGRHIRNGLDFMEQHFARLDENKDGSISKAELADLFKKGTLKAEKLLDLEAAQVYLEGIKVAKKAEHTDVYTEADIKEAKTTAAAAFPDMKIGPYRPFPPLKLD